eukprot:COSAG02_NODE_14979_length_1218_cov_1.165326_2_plen_49_part_00
MPLWHQPDGKLLDTHTAVHVEVEVEAALEQEMSRTLSQIEALRRDFTT